MGKKKKVPNPVDEQIGRPLLTEEMLAGIDPASPFAEDLEQILILAAIDTLATVPVASDKLKEIAALAQKEAARTTNKGLQAILKRLLQKIAALLRKQGDDSPTATPVSKPSPIGASDAKPEWPPSFLAALSGASTMGLTAHQWATLVDTPGLRAELKQRIVDKGSKLMAVVVSKDDLAHLRELLEVAVETAVGTRKRTINAILQEISRLIRLSVRYNLEDDTLDDDDEFDELPPKTKAIYQCKVTLLDTKPPIWRRIQVNDCTLGEFHDILQEAMGWNDFHMHQFIVGGAYFSSILDDEDDEFGIGFPDDGEVEDEDEILLSQIVGNARGKTVRFRYEYDFGDGWLHDILVEKVLAPDPKVKLPRCLAGARACPPEDCGGPWGYADLLHALANPNNPESAEILEMSEERELNPEAFDIAELNARLRND